MEGIKVDKMTPHEKGETAVLSIGDTEVIIEFTVDNRDIRITDGEQIVKVRLDDDCSIRDILQNDQFVSP